MTVKGRGVNATALSYIHFANDLKSAAVRVQIQYLLESVLTQRSTCHQVLLRRSSSPLSRFYCCAKAVLSSTTLSGSTFLFYNHNKNLEP